MNLIDLTEANFDQTLENHEIIIIDFWAEWCGPCKSFERVMLELAPKHPDIIFAKIDIEKEKELSADFNVRSVPLVAIIRKRHVVYLESGKLSVQTLDDLIKQVRDLTPDQLANYD